MQSSQCQRIKQSNYHNQRTLLGLHNKEEFLIKLQSRIIFEEISEIRENVQSKTTKINKHSKHMAVCRELSRLIPPAPALKNKIKL